MLSTSYEFRRAVTENGKLLVKGQLVLDDGTRIDLQPGDFMANKTSFEQSVSSQGSFDIGAAIEGSFSCEIDNAGRKYDQYDFYGSRLLVHVGLVLDHGTEWLRKGTFYVERPNSYGGTISLSGTDSMRLFDVPYDAVGTRYPATASTVVSDICAHCGVPLMYASFPGGGTVFKTRPTDSPSCRSVLSWAAQATGNYARITADDRLEISWYDPSVFDSEDWLDGEEFDAGNPYQSGSNADGGDFLDYSSGVSVDGGTFDAGRIANIHSYSSATVTTDDIVVTGIRVMASDEVLADGAKGREGEAYLSGSEGYVLEVSGNPLISYGEARATAERIAAKTVGLRFRAFDSSCIGDPSIEAGDPAIITDRYNNVHRTYLTRVSFRVGGFASYSCGAEPPLRRSSCGGGAITRAIQNANSAVRAERTAREAAVKRLNDDLANSPGMYTTSKVEGGATTWYVHDKKALVQSQFVWKVNSAGLGISTNGGKSYQFGLDKWGNAILNSIYAIGINADYITAGSLRVRNGGKTIFCADVRAGQFWWDSKYSKLTNTGALTVTSGKIGGMTITGSSIYNSGVLIDGTGLIVRSGSANIGVVKSSNATSSASVRGLSINVDDSRHYVSIGDSASVNGTSYTMRWTYANKAFGPYSANTLNAGCAIDMHWNYLRKVNVKLDDLAIPGSVNIKSGAFLLPIEIQNGAVKRYVKGCRLEFRHGILVSAVLPG